MTGAAITPLAAYLASLPPGTQWAVTLLDCGCAGDERGVPVASCSEAHSPSTQEGQALRQAALAAHERREAINHIWPVSARPASSPARSGASN